jgi:2-iminobutanoate/2-iminopropanoate deaminase
VRQAVQAPGSAPAIGPYSPALKVGNFLFLSGQIPLDPASGQLVTGDIRVQTKRVLDNIGAVLAGAGVNFSHVVKSTVFLVDFDDFAAMNEVYATYFTAPYPARSTVEVSRLPKDCGIEIEVLAVIE